MADFPSVEWFETVRQLVNRDPRIKKLGTCDAVMGVKVRDRAFAISFEAFDCTGVREIAAADLARTDFYLDAPYETWREMIENIKRNGKPDRQHTLNSIDFLDPEGFARAEDQTNKDKFYQYGQTFQQFFNASAEIETKFVEPAPATRAARVRCGPRLADRLDFLDQLPHGAERHSQHVPRGHDRHLRLHRGAGVGPDDAVLSAGYRVNHAMHNRSSPDANPAIRARGPEP